MKLAISFCNQTDGNKKNISILDTEEHSVSCINIDFPNTGFTGVAQNENFIFALYQSQPNGIVIIDKKTSDVLAKSDLAEVIDGHSIVLKDNNLYVVSTGNDSVIKYNYDQKNLKFDKPEILWKPNDSEGRNDTHHLNSLYSNKDKLFISGFGLKKGERWSSAKNGYIFEIVGQRKEIVNIFHPHSVFVYENEIYYTESSTRSIKRNNKTLIKLDQGYTRGLHVEMNLVIIGLSSGRKNSKSTGIINNNADPGLSEPSCKILFFKRRSMFNKYKINDEFDFFPMHQEIYDICKIN